MSDRYPERRRGRVIGIDPGERWIGVAASDDERRLSLPLITIDRHSLGRADDAAAAAARIRERLGAEGATLVVVGVPYDPAGREDAQARTFRCLGERIAASLGLPLRVQCERDTNPPAPAPVPETDRRPGAVSRARRRKQRESEHALAAAAVLQRWLDSEGVPDAPAAL